MVESNFQTLFSHWIENNKILLNGSAVWELKICKNGSMPFDRVAPHQIEKLHEAKEKGLYHKISDSPIFKGSKIRFTKPKPCDCLFVKGEAYVVILFYEPRKPKIAYWINIDDFILEKNTSIRKSLTKERAEKISSRKIIL